MKLLAIETSTEHCSVACWLDGQVHARSELAGQRHSEILLLMIDTLLAEQGLRLQALDGIAFGAGPGSFTGVRIAASVTQGLALGAGIPVLPVCTLEAMAEAAGADRVACALDARLDEVYFAAYRRQGEAWLPFIAPCLASIAELPRLPDGGWQGVGSGFRVQGGALGPRLAVETVQADAFPDAAAVAALGARQLAAGKGLDAAAAQPIYLRDKVALTVAERRARGFR